MAWKVYQEDQSFKVQSAAHFAVVFDVEAYLDREYHAFHKLLFRGVVSELLNRVGVFDTHIPKWYSFGGSTSPTTFSVYEIPRVKDLQEHGHSTEIPIPPETRFTALSCLKEFHPETDDISLADNDYDEYLDAQSHSGGSTSTARAWEFEWNNDPCVLAARRGEGPEFDDDSDTNSSMPTLLLKHDDDSSASSSTIMPSLVPRCSTQRRL